jgi:hypothetical protein
MVYPVSATFPATDQMAIVLGQPSTATGCSPTASGPVSQLTKLGLPISSVLQGTFYYTLDTARLILIKNTSGGGFCSALKNVNGNDVLYFNKL